MAEQVGHFAFAADGLDGLLQFENGFDDFVTHQFGQRVGDADVDAQRTRRGLLPGGVEEFLAQRKYFLGVAQHAMAGLGQRQGASAPPE